MELQGKKATHDFLSLYTKDSSLQVPDARPPSQGGGLFLKTHDFLQPLERNGTAAAAGGAARAAVACGPAAAAAEGSVEHVLPGGIGTYTISHVSDPPPRPVVVKSELGVGKCDAGRGPEARDCGGKGYSYNTTTNNSSSSSYGAGSASTVPFALWEQSTPKDSASRGPSWPSSPFGAAGFGSLASSAARSHSAPEKKRFMESASRSSKCFDDDDDDDEEFGKREASSFHKELTIKVDGKSSGSGTDQRPNTPRSKHSATEQRRRSKINDRFQILRELIPHSDQKRDKASFLLEVIEYIRFLQEKVQKYETNTGWNQDNSKLTPWVKVYFRSFWKNATNSSQVPGDGISDPTQDMKNGFTTPGYMFSGKFDDNNIPVPPAMIPCAQNPTESDMTAGVSYKATETTPNLGNKVAATPFLVQPNAYPLVGMGTAAVQSEQRLVSDADNLTSQAHSEWLRSSDPADCTVSSEMSHEQEELTIDEGTISVSSAYSQGLLTTLTQALQSSGIDLSQASLSVQINLGKRAVHKRPTTAATTSCAKDHEQSRVGSSGEESSQASKKRKSGYS